jgi:hypothetical protein
MPTWKIMHSNGQRKQSEIFWMWKLAQTIPEYTFYRTYFRIRYKSKITTVLVLEHFTIENVEMLWRRVPPSAPQAQAKLVSP